MTIKDTKPSFHINQNRNLGPKIASRKLTKKHPIEFCKSTKVPFKEDIKAFKVQSNLNLRTVRIKTNLNLYLIHLS